ASSFTHSAMPTSFRPESPASLRSLAITFAPSRAKATAVARPMPAAEAVQKASLPLSRSVMLGVLPQQMFQRPTLLRYAAADHRIAADEPQRRCPARRQ